MSRLFPTPEDRTEQARQEAFLRSPEAMRGHPTAPGLRDENEPRMGREDVADGMPGVPRLVPTPGSQGPGIPGPSPSGPLQPGVHYWKGDDDEAVPF
jgi:hypothetical protein